MSKLLDPSPTEVKLAKILRPVLEAEIKRLGPDEAAKRLDLATVGVKALLWHNEWSIARTFRVLDLLGLPAKQTLLEAINGLPEEA